MRNAGSLLLAAGALALLPVGVRAQCEGAAAVGDLGISRLECDCVIAPPTADTEWRFYTEPRILRVEQGSAADGRVQVGDVITAVNGQPILTKDGARALASVKPNQPVSLTVRRDGHEHHFLLRPGAACPTAPTLLGAIAPVQRVQVSTTTPATAAAQRLRAVEAEQAARPAPAKAQVPQRLPAPPRPPAPTSMVPRTSSVWIGIAFSCGECGLTTERGATRWVFRNPPEVYSVEPGSPAYAAGIRRGDVLTHVNNVAITTPEGGRQWANLKPGETVRIRYRRGDNVRTALVRAENPRVAYAAKTPGPEYHALQTVLASRDTATLRALREHQRVLQAQQAEQERVLRAVQEQLRSLPEEQEKVERLLQEYMKQQQKHAERTQAELQRLRQTEQRLQESSRQAMEAYATAPSTAFAGPGAVPARPSVEQRLRYSGTLRGTEVEVRSASPVVVTEQGDEIVVTTQESTVRIRVPRNR